MALYDNKWDWYDMFLPGSTSAALLQQPNFKEDLADFIGWGSARRQREYEANLSNTAYQRSVEDMQKAGLNPYLAYQQGGASVPQGAVSNGHLGEILKLVSTALMLSKGITSSAKGLAGSATNVRPITSIKNYYYK